MAHSAMVHVPPGPFRFGMTDAEKGAAAVDAGVHPDMLHFHSRSATLATPAFWIDMCPVTRGQFLQFVRETGYEIEYSGWRVGWIELVNALADEPDNLRRPMVGVNSEDALAYAEWAGKRLPTEVEWEKASRGTDGRLYPWGHEWRPVVEERDLTFDSAYAVGSRPQLASPYGVQDMAGGVLEWVETVFEPVAPDGIGTDNAPFILAGSSLLHRQPYSHMVTSRWSWHQELRAYNTGFRCVADGGPEPRVSRRPSAPPLLRRASIDASRYRKAPIRLRAYDWPTFTIEVPWFPDSLWVVDIPEGHWGPFGGANDWPHGAAELWQTQWQTSPDGTNLQYARTEGDQMLRVTVTAAADEVCMNVAAANLGPINLGTICVKTFSPFFSSQERLTQCRLEGACLVRACDMPLPRELASSFGWTVGANLPCGAVVTRSHDGRAFVAMQGSEGAECWGNGWPHCTHLRGEAMTSESGGEIRIIFAVCGEQDLVRRLRGE